MKKIFTLLILLLSFNAIKAQIPIGIKYDVNGMPLNGYFDAINYASEKAVSKIHYSDSYEVGYYYDIDGNKIDGLIKYNDHKIFYKKNETDIRQKLTAEEINYLVIGVDSFFVSNNFYYNNQLRNNPEFLQYITEFGDYTIAKYYHFTTAMGQQYGFQDPIIESYLVKDKDSDIWYDFPNNTTFVERALKYFGHIPYLKNKITEGDYTKDDMLTIIKMAEYDYKYKNSKPVFYDKYWQEVLDKERAVYTAYITDIKDSIWTFDYYQDSVKLYKARYSSVCPNVKNGDFISYFPSGKPRQITFYEDDKPIEVKTFTTKGMVNEHYKIVDLEDRYTYGTEIKYIAVNDSLGKNILDGEKQTQLSIKDDISGFIYTKVFCNNKLISAYRMFNSDTVFQFSDVNYHFGLSSLNSKFRSYTTNKEYNNALNENAQGVVMVSMFIDDKGYMINSKILNEVHPELTSLVNDFLISNYSVHAAFRNKLKTYRKDRKKRYYEVVIPFEFATNRFYRRPIQNNMMFMQHQMMMNNMPKFTPPIKTGF